MSHSDLFDGWRDVRKTGYRILYVAGQPTRRAHKSAICPYAHHRVMRVPFGHFPDATINMDSENDTEILSS